MKKILAVLTAALLLLCAVPALAFTGYETAPAMPEITEYDELFFDASVVRLENEPAIEQTPWGESYYVWSELEGDPAFAAGDTLTFACRISVPETVEGASEEAHSALEVRFEFTGLREAEIADATGLAPNSDCDFDAGYCFPLPGYGNAALEDGVLTVDAEPGTEVQVVIQGTAEAEEASCELVETVGQYKLPAHYSVGKVVEEDDCIYVYNKDLLAVQIRGMKFFAQDGVFDHYYVCLNEHDYVRSAGLRGVSYTEVGNEENVITSGNKFDALERGYNDVMGFFGFTDDDVKDALTESVFLDGSEPMRASESFAFGTSEQPAEPTDEPAPADPTDEPAPSDAPVVPAPPQTGAASLALLGAAAVLSGAGVVIFRRKSDR